MTAHASNKPRSFWHLFPYALIAALGVVIAVNVALVWAAEATFTGAIVHPYE